MKAEDLKEGNAKTTYVDKSSHYTTNFNSHSLLHLVLLHQLTECGIFLPYVKTLKWPGKILNFQWYANIATFQLKYVNTKWFFQTFWTLQY